MPFFHIVECTWILFEPCIISISCLCTPASLPHNLELKFHKQLINSQRMFCRLSRHFNSIRLRAFGRCVLLPCLNSCFPGWQSARYLAYKMFFAIVEAATAIFIDLATTKGVVTTSQAVEIVRYHGVESNCESIHTAGCDLPFTIRAKQRLRTETWFENRSGLQV